MDEEGKQEFMFFAGPMLTTQELIEQLRAEGRLIESPSAPAEPPAEEERPSST